MKANPVEPVGDDREQEGGSIETAPSLFVHEWNQEEDVATGALPDQENAIVNQMPSLSRKESRDS
jgi:hypothetical protein